MRKIGAGIIFAVPILIYSFAAAEMSFAENSTSSDSSSAVQTVITIQKALQDKNYEEAWQQRTKFSRQWQGLDEFKLKMERDPALREGIISANIKKIEPVTSRRMWVSASSPYQQFNGFYLVKENGKWKLGNLRQYIKKARSDLRILARAIRVYYRNNKRFPSELSELTVPITYVKTISQDPFSDEAKPYVYKILDEGWILYSLGPDSDDDFGFTTYNPKSGPVSNGDIVVKGKLPEVS